MKTLKIGTRESQLAVWQAKRVQKLLADNHIDSELILIKSEGDIDLVTPLYALGVQGVFTRTLDAALLSGRIDIAVHSMKDVPTQLAQGITQAAVLERANYRDLLVLNKNRKEADDIQLTNEIITIATSSVRRKAQWMNRYPHHLIDNIRGNVNTRLRKVEESNWYGAIFAAAGLERIELRPEDAIELDWMLPAPAQGAIMIVCREEDQESKSICYQLNHEPTAICTKIERSFLKTLMGGCSTPISALAEIKNEDLYFTGNIYSLDGKEKKEISLSVKHSSDAANIGLRAAEQLLTEGADKIVESIRNAK